MQAKRSGGLLAAGRRGVLRQERQRFHPGQGQRDAGAAQEMTAGFQRLICVFIVHLPYRRFRWLQLAAFCASSRPTVAELAAGDDLRSTSCENVALPPAATMRSISG